MKTLLKQIIGVLDASGRILVSKEKDQIANRSFKLIPIMIDSFLTVTTRNLTTRTDESIRQNQDDMALRNWHSFALFVVDATQPFFASTTWNVAMKLAILEITEVGNRNMKAGFCFAHKRSSLSIVPIRRRIGAKSGWFL